MTSVAPPSVRKTDRIFVSGLAVTVFSCIAMAATLAPSGTATLSTSATPNTLTNQPTSPAPAPTPTPTPSPTPGVDPSALGVNLAAPTYYMQDRALMNLAQGATWGSQKKGVSGWHAFNPAQLDANGYVKSLASGERAHMMLVPPEGALGASRTRIRCTWIGKGALSPGGSVSSITHGTNNVEFDWAPGSGKPKTAWVSVTQVDGADYIRQIDCREKTASITNLFSQAFLDQLKGYKILRFMDWQNTNANAPVTWATRVTPQTLNQAGKLGMSVENMVALANQVDADPWFAMPWNADEDFMRRFATYVRDNLEPGRKVYVEMSNEVWNWGFKVTLQARDEGMARGLSKNEGEAMLYRYAQKTVEMQKIWTDVFKANPSRLVRVLATQNANPWSAELALKYGDTAQYVDALATAPYFGGNTFAGTRATITDLTNIFAFLSADVDKAVAKAAENKAVATRYNKRYITYEGGQHIVNAANVPLVTKINRDQRMYGIYKKYLTGWRSQGADAMVLFNSTGPVSQYGAWGMREYAGQPIAETPKRKAAVDYIAKAY